MDFDAVVELALKAGDAVMEVYSGEVSVELKADNTPLTAADRAAHGVIAEGLSRLFPSMPLLSEEGREIPYAARKSWDAFWLVDPLDGTKEFIKRNGEFTVNIALIEGGAPVWGVVHAPALGRTYFGGLKRGASRLAARGAGPEKISVAPPPPEGLTVLKSRSHPSPELEEYLKSVKVASGLEVGSSLKFCAVAEGRAHLYARLGPTMEWDTAAGQAVLEGAGGRVLTMEGERLTYNKENLLNPYFIADNGDSRK